jgi:hypothetical protein
MVANQIVARAFLAKAINTLFKSRPLKWDGNEIIPSSLHCRRF